MKQLTVYFVSFIVFLFGLFLYLPLKAQQVALRGRVLDLSSQQPISGASISLSKKSISVTDANGEFSISAGKGSRLTVSFVGFNDTTIVIGNESYYSIGLTPSSAQLQEVVVTATGIRKESKRLGYAIQTIDAAALTKAREADPINSLKGNAAGLAININSEIGHSPDVIIRGENDPTNRPLFVVDGVPISSDTYNLNPDDIETFTIHFLQMILTKLCG